MSMQYDKIEKILDERQKTYGDAGTNFAITGQIWGALLGLDPIPAWQVALLMDAYKTVRCFANPTYDDSWQDKLGYTRHGLEIINEP